MFPPRSTCCSAICHVAFVAVCCTLLSRLVSPRPGPFPQKKLKTVLIKMVSMAGTGFFYLTRKNPTNVTRKIVLRKFDPRVNTHVLFQETKFK